MNKYIVKTNASIVGDTKIMLLNISENIVQINYEIIPLSQRKDLQKYKLKKHSDMRLLARSFLYEFIKENYEIQNFEIDFNTFQRPFLKFNPEISFSFSYSEDYVLIGVSRSKKKIGVDIEYFNRELDIEEVAFQIMCPEELSHFDKLKFDSDKRNFFFILFCLKESIIKAFGTGLYYPVKSINILDDNPKFFQWQYFKSQLLTDWIPDYRLAICWEE